MSDDTVKRQIQPFPETPEAVARGCACEVARDAGGKVLLSQGRPTYAITKNCPVHDGPHGGASAGD